MLQWCGAVHPFATHHLVQEIVAGGAHSHFECLGITVTTGATVTNGSCSDVRVAPVTDCELVLSLDADLASEANEVLRINGSDVATLLTDIIR